jgi:cytoskeletal protein CcmA (bactofilin family)
MFGGKKAANAAEPTVIGRGAVIEGKVRASGPIQIDGHIDGTLLVDGQVSVGPSGAITGEVSADEIVVGGRVEGKLHARTHLHVAPGGSVRGDVRYGTLQIDRGGLIDGTTAQGQASAEARTPASAETQAEAPRASAAAPLPAASSLGAAQPLAAQARTQRAAS